VTNLRGDITLSSDLEHDEQRKIVDLRAGGKYPSFLRGKVQWREGFGEGAKDSRTQVKLTSSGRVVLKF